MFKWIKDKISALMFGMKGAEDAIMGHGDPYDGGLVIQKEVQDKRVSKHLLKGEVTKEVEELRWRNYAVAKESKNYKYVGDGKASYSGPRKNGESGIVTLYQENKPNVETVLDGVQQIQDKKTTVDYYTLAVTYEMTPRFRIEPNVSSFKVSIKPDEAKITLYVDTIPSQDPRSKPFIDELEKLYQYQGEYFNQRCEISSNVTGMAFVTDKANGEDDMVSYILFGISFVGVEKDKERYAITYSFNSHIRENLVDKYFCKDMADRYSKKEPKDMGFMVFDPNDVEKCSDCGSDVPKLDAFVTKEQFGRVLCQKCFEKRLKNGNFD